MSQQQKYPHDEIIKGVDNRSMVGVGGDLVLNAGSSQNGSSGSVRIGETAKSVIVSAPMFASCLTVESLKYTNVPESAKGDLLVGSKNLPVGLNGQVLTADSNQMLGMRWATPAKSSAAQLLHVNKNGDDKTGDGSISSPYLTIAKALTTITDATASKRYEICVGLGTFTEISLNLKPWIFIAGLGPNMTAIDANVSVDAKFGGSAGISGVNLTALNLTSSGTSNTFYIDNIIANSVTHANNNLLLDSSIIGTLNLDGSAGKINNSSISKFIVTRSSPTAVSSLMFNYCLFVKSSGIANTNTITTTGSQSMVVEFTGCSFGDNLLTLAGAFTTVIADAISIPPKANLTVASATIVRKNDIYGLAYSPTVPANWSGAPTTMQSAIDRIAARLFAVGGNTAIP